LSRPHMRRYEVESTMSTLSAQAAPVRRFMSPRV